MLAFNPAQMELKGCLGRGSDSYMGRIIAFADAQHKSVKLQQTQFFHRNTAVSALDPTQVVRCTAQVNSHAILTVGGI